MTVNEISKENLINLLGHYLSVLPPRWQSMQTYIALYITLVTSILGLLITGASSFKYSLEIFYLIPGYILLFMICRYAKITIKKQNKHLKELIVIIAKLENEIGLYTYKEKENDISLWKNDKYFLTPKWIEARLKSGDSSNEFIDSFQESTVTYIYKLFNTVQFLGFITMTLSLILVLLC